MRPRYISGTVNLVLLTDEQLRRNLYENSMKSVLPLHVAHHRTNNKLIDKCKLDTCLLNRNSLTSGTYLALSEYPDKISIAMVLVYI